MPLTNPPSLTCPPQLRGKKLLWYAGGWLLLSIFIGALGGLMVWWLHDADNMLAWLRHGPYTDFDPTRKPWEPVLHGIGYAVVLCASLQLAMAFARRYIPLRSWPQMMAHIAVLSAFSGLAFTLVHLLFECLPDDDPHPQPSLWLIGGVAFGFSFLLSVVCYSFEFLKRLRQAEHAATQAELRALKAQVHPHFLFNALNTIAALVRSRPQEAEEITEELADLFRYVLRASKQATVSLAEEVQSAQQYLAIEQKRFGPRLEVRIDVPDELGAVRVPGLILQPLVENAVKHGVGQSETPCQVTVRATRDGDAICLRVHDTGPGFATTVPAAVFNSGTGLANVRDRLRLLFGIQAALHLHDDGVELRFPHRVGPLAADEAPPAYRPTPV